MRSDQRVERDEAGCSAASSSMTIAPAAPRRRSCSKKVVGPERFWNRAGASRASALRPASARSPAAIAFTTSVTCRNADHIVQILAGTRECETHAPGPADQFDGGARRGASGLDADKLGPWHHHLACGRDPLGKAEDAWWSICSSWFFEHASLLACRHEHLQLFFRVHRRHGRIRLRTRRPARPHCATPCSTRMKGQSARMKSSHGFTTHIATALDALEVQPISAPARRRRCETR